MEHGPVKRHEYHPLAHSQTEQVTSGYFSAVGRFQNACDTSAFPFGFIPPQLSEFAIDACPGRDRSIMGAIHPIRKVSAAATTIPPIVEVVQRNIVRLWSFPSAHVSNR